MEHSHQITGTFVPLVALLLGLGGSLGHCVGMCSGVSLLFARRGATVGWRVLWLHGGRVMTYTILGFVVGGVGMGLAEITPEFGTLQGAFALIFAVISVYFAASIVGYAPSPELILAAVSRRWGKVMQRIAAAPKTPQPASPLQVFVYGLVWGALPCAFVLTALLTAAGSGSALTGGLAMLAFGLGTWPALLIVHWAGQKPIRWHAPWIRPAMSLLIALFGTQMALRGFATWGWIEHFEAGALMLW